MTQRTRNSHYVARHLTRSWEFGQRKLWVYDFEDDEFSVVSSKKLLTTETPWAQPIEDFLNRYLETPLSGFLARFDQTRNSSDISQEELRALKLAVFLQVPRTGRDEADLAWMAAQGEGYLDGMTAALDQVCSFVHIPLRQECLCFPETGLIMVPFHGVAPGMGIALHPSYLTVAVPRPAEKWLQQIDTYVKSPLNVFSYLSVGLDQCRRVVIPGSAHGDATEAAMRATLKQARFRGKDLVRRMIDSNVETYGTAFPKPAMLRAWPNP